MDELLSVSVGGAFASGKHPVKVENIDSLSQKIEETDVFLRKKGRDDAEGFGWINLPYQDLTEIIDIGRWLSKFDTIVQIGIGGSALGNRMLVNALLPPFYNELEMPLRKGPRFYLLENSDPITAAAMLNRLDLPRTVFVVVSKSGSTTETIAHFLWTWQRAKENLGTKAPEHFLVITDSRRGSLRKFVRARGCRSLEIPESVGGRYSVLSSVGLATAAALGIDIERLLQGAREIDQRLVMRNYLWENPAWVLAGLNVLHARAGRNMSVMMPYGDCLSAFAEWFAQLWGESLGKNGLGTTPVRALGAIDQHSQLQLYMEGPDDKLITIIDVKNRPYFKLPDNIDDDALKDFEFLFGKTMGELLSVEARSTTSALIKAGKPVVYLSIPEVSERYIGALIFFYEYLTALVGLLMDVNPFDQPGVEQGKRYIYSLMGRQGFEEYIGEVEQYFGKCRNIEIIL
ncbi:glucose-6-phosphate isomerase [Acetomicrobium mobile]|uniref:glucose-6-phosphate isomerase n=2 Tax=Acetomicrobium TaxID=49894 RepID=UPI0026EDA962|nr:glucose-6-phosphate isomerase [Acetomicrobium mobile]